MKPRMALLLASLLALFMGGVPALATPPSPSGPAITAGLGAPPKVLNTSNSKAAPVNKKAVKGKTPTVEEGAKLQGKVKTALANPCAPVCYFYAQGAQSYSAQPPANQPTDFRANLRISGTQLDTANDAHSLMELAVTQYQADDGDVGTAPQRNIAEVGWTHDPAVCTAAPADPCLFVFSWINDAPQGYGTGFVRWTGANSAPFGPGDSLSTWLTQSKQFGILVDPANGNVWAYVDNKWIGAWPASWWSSGGYNMSTFAYLQGFTEVAAITDDRPCSDMGNGKLSSDVASAFISNAAQSGSTVTLSLTWGNIPVVTVYTATALSGQSGRLGGFGWNAAGNGAGTQGAC